MKASDKRGLPNNGPEAMRVPTQPSEPEKQEHLAKQHEANGDWRKACGKSRRQEHRSHLEHGDSKQGTLEVNGGRSREVVTIVGASEHEVAAGIGDITHEFGRSHQGLVDFQYCEGEVHHEIATPFEAIE